MLNIGTLTTRWGKIFGGFNEVNLFRGTTLPDRADDIASLYPSAATQRIVVDDLYEDTKAAADRLRDIYNTYVTVAKDTLVQMCVDDSLYPIETDDATVLKKLIADMVAQAEDFLLPTVTVNGSEFAAATAVVTELGAAKGNGTIVGSTVEPRTGKAKLYALPETVRAVCVFDSYSGGVFPGTEVFQVTGFGTVPATDPLWPKGSGVNVRLTSTTTLSGALVTNPYFEDWDTVDTNKLDTWETANLVLGTNIVRSASSYTGSFAAEITAAPVNAEISQTVNNPTGATNYIAALRVQRTEAITAGVVTVALRDSGGTILQDAQGGDLSFTISLSGAAGAYFLTLSCFALQRSFPTTVKASIKWTTAMAAGETILIDTFELMPMQSLYTGGPDIAFLPGSVAWANGDTYTLVVENDADTETFVRNIDRIYDIKSIPLDLPVDAAPTVDDALIS